MNDFEQLRATNNLAAEISRLRESIQQLLNKTSTQQAQMAARLPAVGASLSDQAFPDVSPYARRIESTLGGVLDTLVTRGNNLQGVLQGAYSSLINIATQANIINPFVKGLGLQRREGEVDGGGIISTFLRGLLGRAYGGPVNAGQPYMVGEQGPELFVPNEAGQIMPRGKSASGVNITMNITTPDAGSFKKSQAQIGAMLADAVKRGQRIR